MMIVDVKTGIVYEMDEPSKLEQIFLVKNDYEYTNSDSTFSLSMNNLNGKIFLECEETTYFSMYLEPGNYLYMFRSYFMVGIKFINQAEIYLFGV